MLSLAVDNYANQFATSASASDNPAGFLPPACAMSGRPPPPPPTFGAIALIKSPAFNPFHSL